MGLSGGVTAQKTFKQQEHRRERRAVNSLLTVEEFDNHPDTKKYGNEWASPRDGKMWMDLKNPNSSKWMRK